MKVKLGFISQHMLLLRNDRKRENMNRLFENSSINEMNLPNRFVRSATWEGMAIDDGAVTPKLFNHRKPGDLLKAECTSDNQCFGPGYDGEGIYCVSKTKKEIH